MRFSMILKFIDLNEREWRETQMWLQFGYARGGESFAESQFTCCDFHMKDYTRFIMAIGYKNSLESVIQNKVKTAWSWSIVVQFSFGQARRSQLRAKGAEN